MKGVVILGMSGCLCDGRDHRYCVRVEGLLVSVRIHQRKDSRGDRVGGGRVGGGRVGGGRVGGGRVGGRRDCPAGYCFGLWGGWNI